VHTVEQGARGLLDDAPGRALTTSSPVTVKIADSRRCQVPSIRKDLPGQAYFEHQGVPHTHQSPSLTQAFFSPLFFFRPGRVLPWVPR